MTTSGPIPLPGAPPEVGTVLQESDSCKFTLKLPEGLETESVILRYTAGSHRVRHTLCLSSQVGCAMGCTFCETAQMGLMRNLTCEEIVAQWRTARYRFDTQIDNVVFMGMGEPMDNVEAVLAAIEVLADQRGPSIPPARITVSTVGRTDGIDQYTAFADREGFRRLRLAVSINAPNDEIRSRIMPLNRAEPMARLMAAMQRWTNAQPRRRVLIEYVLIPGVNDETDHAAELCVYLRDLPCTVNIIPYNPRRGSPWPAPSEASIGSFVRAVHELGQRVTRRRTIGRTSMAACGQLGNEAIRRRRWVEVG